MSQGEATWEGKGVSLGQIDAQLQRLWRATDSDWNGDGRRPDIRTSVLNLIVYAINEDCCERAQRAIDHLSGTHPSRAVIIVPGEGQGELSIDARLSVCSHGAYAEYRQVCSEQLVLTVHGQASQHLASVIYPLLAPDLPVFLWWPGETPFHHHLYGQLRDIADRFIVDSSDFASPAHDLVGMAHAVHGSGSVCTFSDFNWARLAPWREMVAQFFDQEQFRPHLDQLQALSIECVPTKGSSTYDLPQALLLSGWLASRLGLHAVERRHHYELSLANGTRSLDVDIKVAPEASTAPVTIRLQTGVGAAQPAEFKVSLDRASGHVTATAALAGQPPLLHKATMIERDEGQLLFEELKVFGRDRVYEQALLCASNMLDPTYHRQPVKGSLLA